MQIKQALNWATRQLKETSSSANLDAEILLLHVLKIPLSQKHYLIKEANQEISKTNLLKYQRLIARRKKYEPVAYIINHKEFYGLDFYVNKNVLIPRPETEVLVEEVVKEVKPNMTAVEVGTGSGCISVSLAKQCPNLNIYAIDISPNALMVAKKNAKMHGTIKQIKFLKGDLFSPLITKKDLSNINLIIANLPYLDENFSNLLTSTETKGIYFEPKIAWDGGKNGTEVYQKLFRQIPNNWHGTILIEIGSEQKNLFDKSIEQRFKKAKIKIIKDYLNLPRILKIVI